MRALIARCLMFAAGCLLPVACAPAVEPLYSPVRPTPTPLVVVAVVRATGTPALEPTEAGPPTPVADGALGIADTLRAYIPVQDVEGSQTGAMSTLRDFTDPNGVYHGAWWFADDGSA